MVSNGTDAYFFNVNGTENAEYGDGEDFPDNEAAWHEAAGEIFTLVLSGRETTGNWKSLMKTGNRFFGFASQARK
jgi:hypothetical protein